VLHDLHVVQSGIVLPEHIDLFEKGIARKLDFSFSGPQSHALPRVLNSGKVELGAIHTYIELFARYFVDLTPHVALTVARSADRAGNLYMGPNTEDSPAVIEATAFKGGIVVAQVNEVVDKLPRVDIPGDRVDFVVVAPKPFYVEPLFTRDPASITELQILAAMIAIKGIYAEYDQAAEPWHWLQHRRDRAAASDLRGKARAQGQDRHALGAQPASDPHSRDRVGVGQTDPQLRLGGGYGCLHARPVRYLLHRAGRLDELQSDVLPACRALRDGPVHRLHIADRPERQQLDGDGGPHRRLWRRTQHGFGRAWPPPPERAWLKAGREAVDGHPQLMRGRKLVVQLVETFSEKMVPVFVEKLDSLELAEKFKLDLAPVMIYGDDVTHIVSEEGIANLLLCRTAEEREQAIRGIAGFTEMGRRRDRKMVEKLRERKVIRRPEDLGINPLDAHRSMLAARSIEDLMHWSGNLYDPPHKFRNW
jgi:malonate decarboxylase alpha subunit